jgi:hypothetical protein
VTKLGSYEAHRERDSDHRDERRKGLFLVAVCALTQLPLLANKGLYWDDWANLWLFWCRGSDALLQQFIQAAHIGYWLTQSLVFGLGGEYVGVVARIVAVACHFGNTWVFYNLLKKIEITKCLAVWIVAVFVLSPFYQLRSMVIQFHYDLFLLCYLLSILVLHSSRILFSITALALFGFSMSYETLLCLEPLRFAYVRAIRGDTQKAIKECSPFWVMGVIYAVVRMTLLIPFGTHEGYNRLHLDAFSLGFTTLATLHGYVRSIWFTLDSAYHLVGLSGMLLLVPALASVTHIWIQRKNTSIDLGSQPTPVVPKALAFGALLVICGTLPYLLLGRYCSAQNYTSRFLFVSLPGISICIAALVAAIPYRFLRTFCFLVVLTLLSLSSLHVSKAFLFESLVRRDLIMQMDQACATQRKDPLKITLKMVPPSPLVLALRRHFSDYDLDVPINMLRHPSWPLIFIRDAGFSEPSPWDGCTLAAVEKHPCPSKCVVLEYRLLPDRDCVDKVSYLELLQIPFLDYHSLPKMGSISGMPTEAIDQDSDNCSDRMDFPARHRCELVGAILRFKPVACSPRLSNSSQRRLLSPQTNVFMFQFLH